MNRVYSLLLTLTLYLGFSLDLQAQFNTMNTNMVRFRVLDASTKEPLPDVTVKLVNRIGNMSTSVGGTTDSLGWAMVYNLGRSGTLELEALGYKSFSRRFVNTGGDTLNLGVYELEPLEVLLNTAVVTGKARRFITKGDTIIYNPEAFNLPEGSRLEDLLLKLPGVSLKEGQLFWNNKPLRLMMNGRSGVASNTTLMNQLPVEAIDRIKTYDKGSKLEDLAGQKDGEEDHVLDVIIKESFLDKWSGYLTARAQSRGQYEGEANLYRLSTHTPIMVLLNANNLGTSYDDWSESMSMSMQTFGQHLFAGVGADHHWQGKKEESPYEHKIHASGYIKRTDIEDRSSRTTETFLPNTNRLFGLGQTNSLSRNVAPILNLGLEHQLNTLTTLSANAKVAYSRRRNLKHERFARFEQNPYLFADDPLTVFANATGSEATAVGLLNRSNLSETNHTDVFTSTIYGTLSRRFKDNSELLFSFTHNYQHNRSTTTENNDYFYAQNGGSYVNAQNLLLGGGHSTSWGIDVAYHKWFGKKLFWEQTYNFTNNRGDNHSDFYRLSTLPGYTSGHQFTPAELESVRSRSASWHEKTAQTGHQFSSQLTYKGNKWQMRAEAVLKFTHERSDFQQGAVDTVAKRNYATIDPKLSLRYEFDKNNSMEGTLSYTTAMPTLKNTIDFLDNSDPLTIVRGNSALGRSHQQRAELTYYTVNARQQRNLSMALSYTKDIHPFATLTNYNSQTGVYTTMPVQVRGGYLAQLSAQLDQGIGTDFQIVAEFSPNMGRDYGWLATTTASTTPTLNTAKRFGYYSNLRLSYTKARLNVDLMGKINYTYRDNSSTTNYSNRLYEFSFGPSLQWDLGKLAFRSSLSCAGRHGYAMEEMNRLRPYLNLEASYKCFKQKGRIELRWADVFNKIASIRGTSNNYERTELIQHYNTHFFQVAFIYQFDAKGDKKK